MQGLYFDELSVGQSAEVTHVVGAADIEAFAAVSGDVNPVHMDEEFAKTTAFGGRIAHGMLLAAYISAVLGNDLPGPGSIYLSQSMRFRRPVKIGDPVTALRHRQGAGRRQGPRHLRDRLHRERQDGGRRRGPDHGPAQGRQR